jgi:hypothetical protein
MNLFHFGASWVPEPKWLRSLSCHVLPTGLRAPPLFPVGSRDARRLFRASSGRVPAEVGHVDFSQGKCDVADKVVIGDRIRFSEIDLATRQPAPWASDSLG